MCDVESHRLFGDHLPKNVTYVVGFLRISLLISVLVVVRMIWVFVGSIRTSIQQFDIMTSAVLYAPLRWLDTVPVGRTLKWFIADFSVIGSRLATDLSSLNYFGLRAGRITVAKAFVSPWLILCAIPLIAICLGYVRMYLAGTRNVKRLDRFLIKFSHQILNNSCYSLPSIGVQADWPCTIIEYQKIAYLRVVRDGSVGQIDSPCLERV